MIRSDYILDLFSFNKQNMKTQRNVRFILNLNQLP